MIYDVMLGLTLVGFGSYGLRWLARETYACECSSVEQGGSNDNNGNLW